MAAEIDLIVVEVVEEVDFLPAVVNLMNLTKLFHSDT